MHKGRTWIGVPSRVTSLDSDHPSVRKESLRLALAEFACTAAEVRALETDAAVDGRE